MKFRYLLVATLFAVSWQAQALSLSTFNAAAGARDASLTVSPRVQPTDAKVTGKPAQGGAVSSATGSYALDPSPSPAQEPVAYAPLLAGLAAVLMIQARLRRN